MDTLYFRTHEGRRDAAPQATTVKGKDAKIATGAYDALNEASTDLGDTVNLGIIATVSALGYADCWVMQTGAPGRQLARRTLGSGGLG